MNELSHSGKSMLSGMNVKPSAVTEAEIDAFVAAGGQVKVIKSRKAKRHNTRSKSYTFWRKA